MMNERDEPRPDDTLSRRLWTPWRMTYVGGESRESGCIFCNRLNGPDDVSALMLHRDAYAFAIMNLFPYNTGHVMIVPNEHVDSPEHASADALAGMSALLPPLLRALRRALGCQGFNVGFNVGAVAGAGVAEHLHEHVVPRWTGDANFMPILGSTMVIPELIPVAYAKIRAELQRELEGARAVTLVVLDPDRRHVVVEPQGALPAIRPAPDQPMWKAAALALRWRGVAASVSGWAGPNRAGSGGAAALTLLAAGPATPHAGWLEIEHARTTLGAADRTALESALAHLAPVVAAPGAAGEGPA